MANFAIPNRPAQSDTRDITLIEADFDAVTGYLDDIYKNRKLLWRGFAYVPAGTVAGDYVLCKDGTIAVASSAVVTKAWEWFWLDANDYTAGPQAKVPKIFLTMSGACGTPPLVTISGRVNAMSVAISTNNMVPQLGTLLVGGVGILLNASTQILHSDGFGAAANIQGASGVPGAFMPLLNLTGTTAANSDVNVEFSAWLTYL